MKKLGNTENKLIPAIFFLLLIILVQILTMKLNIPKYILPSPLDVIKVLVKDRALLMEHAKITLFESISGFIVAVILGIILGGLLGYFKLLKNILYPVILISQMIT